MRFDQDAINAAVGSSSIASAKLRLYLTENGNNFQCRLGHTVGVHRMKQAWTENGVTLELPQRYDPEW